VHAYPQGLPFISSHAVLFVVLLLLSAALSFSVIQRADSAYGMVVVAMTTAEVVVPLEQMRQRMQKDLPKQTSCGKAEQQPV
jgi:hypothetical protein